LFGQLSRHRSGNDIRRAARSERHDNPDRLIWIWLRFRVQADQAKHTEPQRDYYFYAFFHFVSFTAFIILAMPQCAQG
jgi:hypothetical protein